MYDDRHKAHWEADSVGRRRREQRRHDGADALIADHGGAESSGRAVGEDDRAVVALRWVGLRRRGRDETRRREGRDDAENNPTPHAYNGTPQSVNSIRVLPRIFGFT